MTLHAQIHKLLNEIGAEPVFQEIHNGREFPLLTDYHLRKWPEEWTNGPPTDLVGGKELTPLFVDADGYSIYCIDSTTGVIYDIDPEQPWPATSEFATWRQFKEYLFRVTGAEKSQEEQATLGNLLHLNSEGDNTKM